MYLIKFYSLISEIFFLQQFSQFFRAVDTNHDDVLTVSEVYAISPEMLTLFLALTEYEVAEDENVCVQKQNCVAFTFFRLSILYNFLSTNFYCMKQWKDLSEGSCKLDYENFKRLSSFSIYFSLLIPVVSEW